jgi:hypothetical protein
MRLSLITYVVNFGKSKTNLTTVGYQFRGSSRSTAGVTELFVGTGIYGVTVTESLGPGYILWDTGEAPLVYSAQEINVPLASSLFKIVNFGLSKGGLATVGFTIGGQRLTVAEIVAGTGIYGGMVTPPRGFVGPILWDTGEGQASVYSVDFVNSLYHLISYFPTSSYYMKNINNQVGSLELRL